MEAIDGNQCADQDGSADGREEREEHLHGPFVREVAGDFDLDGIVWVIGDHEWGGRRGIEGLESCFHCCGGWCMSSIGGEEDGGGWQMGGGRDKGLGRVVVN